MAFPTGQSFRTSPLPNYQPCVYTLSIRAPGYSQLDFLTYTFPLSPAMLRRDQAAMTAIYDTSGTPQQLGVNRDADLFGLAPPIFMIEGTTGWQRHQSDGYLYTGLQSLKAVQNLLNLYTQLNQTQLQNTNAQAQLYNLEFYDFFRNDFWQVVPEGPQGIWQSKDKPLLCNYRFRLVAIQPVNAPIIAEVDALAQVFATPAAAAAINLTVGLANYAQLYSQSGISGVANQVFGSG